MKGRVIRLGENSSTGDFLGVQVIGHGLVVPLPFREADVRKLEPGLGVEFMTSPNGVAEILRPRPCVGCERRG
jgi:hypothetical protein